MKAVGVELNEFRDALEKKAERYDIKLAETEIARLCGYYQLLLEWNPRAHLVAPCSPGEFATRHVLESLLLLPCLSHDARIADVGSGAGLPIIPVLIKRADVFATLIESSKRKAVFLRGALRVTGLSEQAMVIAERFENISRPDVNYVTSRALDRFTEMLPKLIQWAQTGSTLLLFGGETLRKKITQSGLASRSIHIPDSERRFLFVIKSEPRPVGVLTYRTTSIAISCCPEITNSAGGNSIS